MEITRTTVTRNARHTTPTGIFSIDYTTTDERLDHVGVDVFRSPLESGEETFIGTVQYDGHNIACNLPMEEDLAHLFETAVGFIAEIIESTGHTPEEEAPDNNKQR